MAAKDQLKSARKLFLIMKVKTSIIQLNGIADEEIDVELEKIRASLAKTFGDNEALEILESSIKAADDELSKIMVSAVQTEMAKQ